MTTERFDETLPHDNIPGGEEPTPVTEETTTADGEKPVPETPEGQQNTKTERQPDGAEVQVEITH